MNRAARSTCRTIGALGGALVALSLGLFGSVGWLAALLLGVIFGVMLAAMLIWLICEGETGMDGEAFAPALAAPAQPSAPAAPVLVRQSAPQPERADEAGDDLMRIKGIGPKARDGLVAMGVTRFEQIAAWDMAQIRSAASVLGIGAGRIRREDWVGQARTLAAQQAEGTQ